MSEESRLLHYDKLKEMRDFIENDGGYTREELLKMSEAEIRFLVLKISGSL
jgi:hypothetical protein